MQILFLNPSFLFDLSIIFVFFLNIFRTPVLAGRSYEFMFVSPSVSVHLAVCKPFFSGITRQTFLIFGMVTGIHE